MFRFSLDPYNVTGCHRIIFTAKIVNANFDGVFTENLCAHRFVYWSPNFIMRTHLFTINLKLGI